MSGPATRNTSGVLQRSPDGRFEKKCGCLQHTTFSNEIAGRNSFLSCKTLSKWKPYQKLVEHGLISHWSNGNKWLCRKCLAYSKTHFVKTATKWIPERERANVQDCENLSMNEETDGDEIVEAKCEWKHDVHEIGESSSGSKDSEIAEAECEWKQETDINEVGEREPEIELEEATVLKAEMMT